MFRFPRNSISVLLVMTALLSACSRGDNQPRIGSISMMNGTALFSSASNFKERKQYREAAQAYSLLAGWGRGWEVAQYQLGVCLLEMAEHPSGIDNPADLRREAYSWIKLAADSGNKQAQSRLALMLRDGIGTDPDLKEAAKYSLLSEQGSGDIPLVRDAAEAAVGPSLMQRLSPADWEEAKKQAKTFSPIVQSTRQPTPGDHRPGQ